MKLQYLLSITLTVIVILLLTGKAKAADRPNHATKDVTISCTYDPLIIKAKANGDGIDLSSNDSRAHCRS